MLGIHVAKKSKINGKNHKTMYTAIKDEIELLNINACQIFTHGPRSYNENKMNYSEIETFSNNNNINISIHGSYLSVSIWNVNKKNVNSPQSKKSIDHITDMLKSAKKINATGVVIHLPNKEPKYIVETMEVLSSVHDIYNTQTVTNIENIPMIILEMPASKPDNKTYETSEKLNHLCEMIKANKNITIKWELCIDTSHQWSCGIKMNEYHTWHSWLNNLTEYTRKKIRMIHLNGNSVQNFGKGKDVHEIIMSPQDGIWGDLITDEIKEFIKINRDKLDTDNKNFYLQLTDNEKKNIKNSSLGAIVDYAKKENIPLILEINRGEYIYTKVAIDIIKGLLH